MFVLRGVGCTERIENIHFEHHVFGMQENYYLCYEFLQNKLINRSFFLIHNTKNIF